MRAGHDVDPAWEGNPLLAHLGKQAIDSFCSFERDLVTEGQEYDVITHHAAQTGTLLARLQADIRAARQPAGDKPVLPLKDDRSLRVHRCHNPRREVEVLRDELLDAFDALPGLKASDVLILAPDLDTYGPQAEAILREGDPALPLRLSERRLDRSDPLVRALHLLLKLSAGRAPLSAGLALLELPAVIKYLESRRTDTETLANLLRAAGITWGLNAAHRQGLHAGNTGTGTWRDGLDRLLAGVWLGHAHEAADADGRPALPVAGDLGADPESIGNGLDWIDGVITLLETWQQEAGPSEWADRLGNALESVLAANHTRFDTTAALDIVNQLRTAETRHGCGLPLDVATVTDWLEHAALDETRTVTQVGGNLAMGGFKPLRAIPCRVLAVLGLQDAVFPRRARPPAWDLLAARPYPGDRDPVREDRQLFLDALLAPSDRVILTATARNIRTNKAEPLSSCVDECLRVAAQTVSRGPGDREDAHRKLIVDHRLQPFSADCFAAPGNSFDAVNFKVARTLGQGLRGSDISFYQHPIDSRSVDADLDLQDVIRILKDPCSAWLRSLGIEIPSAAEDPAALDREPVATPAGLNRWQIQAEVINAELEGRTAHLQERLAADRLMPYGELGTAMGQAAMEEARALARLAIHLADGPLQPHRLVYRAGMSPVTGNITVDPCLAEHVLIMPSDLTKRAHYRLETWVRAVFAAASGMQVETLVISKRGSQPMAQRMPPMDPGQAREAFDHLLDVCLDARSRPLPFAPETSRAIYKALQENKHQQNKNDIDRARTVWNWQGEGLPGEGNRPAPQLAWRDRHPFPEARVDIGQPTAPDDVPVADAATGLGKKEALDEWRELANWIYKRVDGWFASAKPVNPDGPI